MNNDNNSHNHKNHNHKRLRIPKSRLTRDAERVREICQRHAGKDPSLDARGAAVAPTAERYMASNRAQAGLAQQAALRRLERNDLARGLREAVLRWIPSVRLDLPGFDTSGLTDSDVAEDGVESSRLLRERVEACLLDGAELAYAAQLEAALVAQEESVLSAARSANAANVAAQQARWERHAIAVELDNELIAFRATLRRVVGTAHADYQQLRARPDRREPEPDDALEPDSPEAPSEAEASAELDAA